jgi:hypothetical protein
MAVEIKADVGAADANSFITEDEMTAYCDGRLNAAIWTGDEAQLPALVEASRDLSLMEWIGIRSTSTQALGWPREYVPNPDLRLDNFNELSYDLINRNAPVYYANTEIPQRIKDATAELALQYLKAGTSDLAVRDTNAGVIEKTVGPLTTRWESSRAKPEGISKFNRILALIGPLLKGTAGSLRLNRV